jgi:hypothetical protein
MQYDRFLPYVPLSTRKRTKDDSRGQAVLVSSFHSLSHFPPEAAMVSAVAFPVVGDLFDSPKALKIALYKAARASHSFLLDSLC